MPFDSDVALLGTGAAPLIAANHLLAQGKSVLLLNPDRDFFLEDSELPLDPFLPIGPATFAVDRLARSLPESALAELRPDFPGAVEAWSKGPRNAGGNGPGEGYHDTSAPHVRSRARLWIGSNETRVTPAEEALEAFYVEAADGGYNPQTMEGLQAAKRFPGVAAGYGEIRGVLLPKLADVDVARYREGLLEFVRERLGAGRVVCGASQLELMPEGVRFHSGGAPQTARLAEGMLVFWTPRLSQWIFNQMRRLEVHGTVPAGARLWEQWSILSRDPIDPSVAGVFGDSVVWAEVEGVPPATGSFHLAVLRTGPLADWREVAPAPSTAWCSAESFESLSSLFHGFLKWDRFSVRAMQPRAILEWPAGARPWPLSASGPRVNVVPGCDGPLFDVARVARAACDELVTPTPGSLL